MEDDTKYDVAASGRKFSATYTVYTNVSVTILGNLMFIILLYSICKFIIK